MLWGRKGRHELCPLQPQLHPSLLEPPNAAHRQKELYSRLSARQIVQKQTATMHPKFTGVLLDFTSMSWLQRQRRKKSPAGDEEPVAPAGTCPHKGLSVLAGKWESTTVATFVTSSYGQQAAWSSCQLLELLKPPTEISASVLAGWVTLYQWPWCILGGTQQRNVGSRKDFSH